MLTLSTLLDLEACLRNRESGLERVREEDEDRAVRGAFRGLVGHYHGDVWCEEVWCLVSVRYVTRMV